MGAGSTIWSGPVFSLNCLDCDLILLHNRFPSPNGTSSVCNNGAIVARSVYVKGNNYTSQLNVTLTSDTAGKTISCLHDNGTYSTTQLSIVTPTIGLSPCIHVASQSHEVV